MLLCLKAENRMRFRSSPQMIILALLRGGGKCEIGVGVGRGGEGVSGGRHRLEYCSISTLGECG